MGMSLDDVMNLTLAQFDIYVSAASRRIAIERAQTVNDLMHAIASVFSGKGGDKYINSLLEELE